MKISLIITTYNWVSALNAVLESILHQNELPDEVIIADDGSGEETRSYIAEKAKSFPVPLIHSWQEDDGFRAAMSRNKAIAKAKGDYIIIIDGDIVLAPDFIRSHKKAAKPGWFVQGGRVLLNKNLSEKVCHHFYIPSFFAKGMKNRKNCISNPLLASLFSYERNNDKATRSCNMAFWRQDAIAVNGFNQDFIGWGREDSEFVHRLLNSGIKRLYLKFAGVGFHLYHNENSRASLSENDKLLAKTINNKLTRCENGIEQYLG